jgi:tRNA/rRNA methyltransferase
MKLSFIFYKPVVPENIGAAARAMKTMGYSEMRLIEPNKHLSRKARMLAHGSTDILENAKVFDNFQEAISDIDFKIATTAKRRSAKEDYLAPSEVRTLLENKSGTIEKVAIVFGTEESGLPNEIISACDIASTIPLANPYPSLNLGQAAMLYAYELSSLTIHEKHKEGLDVSSYNELRSRTEEILKIIGIPEEMPLYDRILERMGQLAGEDVNLLHSITGRIWDRIVGK